MSTRVQFRRGNTAQTAAFTGAVGEVTVNTDNNTLVVQDGVTAGGWQTPTLAFTQAAFNTANAAATSTFTQAAFDKANSANVLAQASYNFANTVNTYAYSAYSAANTAASNTVVIQSVDATQNSWIAANQIYSQAAFGFANTVNTYAYSAYSTANSAQSNTINIQGVDATQNSWISSNATLLQSAYSFANTVNTYTYSAYSTANSAQANTVISQGVEATQNNWISSNAALLQSAYNKANGAVQTGFTTITANGTSITPSTNTDTLTITANVANGIFILNPTTKTIDFGLRNSGVTAAAYGNTTSIPTITVDSFGRVTSVSNNSITVPPGTTIFANSGQLTANASTGNVALGLAASGVTSGVYGNTTSIPTITIDTYGRITSVSNNAISTSFTITDGTNSNTVSGGSTLTLKANASSGITTSVNNNETVYFGVDTTVARTNTSGIGTQTFNTDINLPTNNLTVGGTISVANLNISGYIIQTNATQTLNVVDPIIYLAANNNGNVVDIGLVGHFIGTGHTGDTSHYQHTGFVRDYNDNKWKLFSNVSTEPTTTVLFDATTYYDTIKVGGVDVSSGNIASVANITFTDGTSQTTNAAPYAYSLSAYNQANNALSNTTSVITVNGTSQLVVANTTASTSNTTGALTVAGGLGVKGNVYSNAIYTNGLFYSANGNPISTGGGGSSSVINLADGTQIYDNNAAFLTTTANVILDVFSSTTFRSAQYLIQAVCGSDVHLTNVLLTHNDVNVYLAEYGTVYSSSLIIVDSSIDTVNNTVTLAISPTVANTIVDFVRTSLISRTLSGGPIGDLQTYVAGTEDVALEYGTLDLSS